MDGLDHPHDSPVAMLLDLIQEKTPKLSTVAALKHQHLPQLEEPGERCFEFRRRAGSKNLRELSMYSGLREA